MDRCVHPVARHYKFGQRRSRSSRSSDSDCRPNAWPRLVLYPALAQWAMPWTSTGRNRDRPIKTELIHHRGLWCGHDDVELATLKWVDWRSHQRLRIACHDLTPANTN
jgi:hypothetical protein